VTLKYQTNWFTTLKDGSTNPKYEISISMASSFTWDEGIPEDVLNNLLKYNAGHILYHTLLKTHVSIFRSVVEQCDFYILLF